MTLEKINSFMFFSMEVFFIIFTFIFINSYGYAVFNLPEFVVGINFFFWVIYEFLLTVLICADNEKRTADNSKPEIECEEDQNVKILEHKKNRGVYESIVSRFWNEIRLFWKLFKNGYIFYVSSFMLEDICFNYIFKRFL